MPEPWDRQSGESEEAYASFVVFRDLGPARSISEAYRHKSGIRGAQQASGRFKAIAEAHNWRDRALAWDNHRTAVATRAADRATEQVVSKWVTRSDTQADADYAFAQKYAGEMARRLNSPLLAEMPIRDLKSAVDVTAAASALAWAAIQSQLPNAHVDLDPHTATTEQLKAAIERLEAAIGTVPVSPRIARAG